MEMWGRFKGRSVQRDPRLRQLEETLATVQAYAASHGGKVELLEWNESGEVKIKMRGACAFCPLVDLTVKSRIERTLKDAHPEIVRVIVV